MLLPFYCINQLPASLSLLYQLTDNTEHYRLSTDITELTCQIWNCCIHIWPNSRLMSQHQLVVAREFPLMQITTPYFEPGVITGSSQWTARNELDQYKNPAKVTSKQHFYNRNKRQDVCVNSIVRTFYFNKEPRIQHQLFYWLKQPCSWNLYLT